MADTWLRSLNAGVPKSPARRKVQSKVAARRQAAPERVRGSKMHVWPGLSASGLVYVPPRTTPLVPARRLHATLRRPQTTSTRSISANPGSSRWRR